MKDLKQPKGVHVHASKPKKIEKIAQSDELNLAPDVRQTLLDMQNKGIDHNQVVRELLKERNQRIQQEKQKIAEELREKEGNKVRTITLTSYVKKQDKKQPSRYIPQKVKHLLKQEYGEKCAHQQCVNKATNIHHKLRFALNPSHDPVFLVPLCKQHHEIAHTVDIRTQEFRIKSLSTSRTTMGRLAD